MPFDRVEGGPSDEQQPRQKSRYQEAREAHAERLAEMRKTGGRLIKDYIDPSEPPMHPPRRRSRHRRSRSQFMNGPSAWASASVGELRADLPPLSQSQIAHMEAALNKE